MKDKTIIIISSLPWQWTTDYVKQTAKVLAKNNLVFVFLKDERDITTWKKIFLGKIKLAKIKIWGKCQKINLFRPFYFLPFRRFESIEKLNLLINIFILKVLIWLKDKKHSTKILWLFNPGDYQLTKVFNQSYFLLYDMVDYFASLDKKLDSQFKKGNDYLFEKACLVTTISVTLKNLYQKKRRSIFLVPQGFALEKFQKYLKLKSPLNLPKAKPILGYLGGLNFRLDYKLLFSLIKTNPQWHFVFVGLKQEDVSVKVLKTEQNLKKLFSFPNVFYYPLQPKKYLPSIISQFDIGFIPYNTKDPFNRYSYPMKVFEYFYMGKPVVSTPIEELKRFPKYVKIGNTAREWEEHIKTLLSRPWPEKYEKRQKKLAIANSWQEKIEKISQVLEEKCRLY